MTSWLFNRKHMHGFWVVMFFSFALAAPANAQVNWPNGNTFTPVPGPAGGNPAGDFEFRQGTSDDNGVVRPVIEIRFKPKPAGMPCASTALVQTFSETRRTSQGSQHSCGAHG
jgi:hypothetical protein